MAFSPCPFLNRSSSLWAAQSSSLALWEWGMVLQWDQLSPLPGPLHRRWTKSPAQQPHPLPTLELPGTDNPMGMTPSHPGASRFSAALHRGRGGDAVLKWKSSFCNLWGAFLRDARGSPPQPKEELRWQQRPAILLRYQTCGQCPFPDSLIARNLTHFAPWKNTRPALGCWWIYQ